MANSIKASIELDIGRFVQSVNKANIELSKITKSFKISPEAKQGIDGLATAFDKTVQSGKELQESLKKSLAVMAATGQKGTAEFKALEAQLKQVTLESKKIDSEFEKIDSKKFGSIGENLKGALSGALKGGAIALVAGLGAAVANSAQEFNKLDVATRTMATLGEEAEKLSPVLQNISIQMSSELPFAASELQTAFTNAIASGVQGGAEELKTFVDTAAKLAVGGGTTIEGATAGLGSTLNAFGAKATEAGKYADTFFNTVNYGVTTIEELNQYLSQVTPTAAAAKLSFENVGAALALMTQKGVPTAQSTTKLNALLIEIQKPGKELEKIFENAGLSVEQLGSVLENEGLPSALNLVQTAFDKAGLSATQAFSSSEAGAAFNILQGKAGEFQGMLEQISNTAGSTENAFNKMSGSFDNQLTLIKNSVTNAFLPAIQSLMPLITNVLKGLGPILQQGIEIFAPIIESIGNVVLSIFEAIKPAFEGFAKEASPLFKELGKLIMGVLTPIMPLLPTIFKLLEPIFKLLTPILKIVTALVVPIVEVAAFIADKLVSGLALLVDLLLGGVTDGLNGLITGVGKTFKVIKVLAEFVWNVLVVAFESYMSISKGLSDFLYNIFKPVIDGIGAAFKWWWDLSVSFGNFLFNVFWQGLKQIGTVISDIGNFIKTLVIVPFQLWFNITKSLSTAIYELASKVPFLKNILDGIIGVVQKISGFFSELISKLATIFGFGAGNKTKDNLKKIGEQAGKTTEATKKTGESAEKAKNELMEFIKSIDSIKGKEAKIKAITEALSRLEQLGMSNTDVYKNLSANLGKLKEVKTPTVPAGEPEKVKTLSEQYSELTDKLNKLAAQGITSGQTWDELYKKTLALKTEMENEAKAIKEVEDRLKGLDKTIKESQIKPQTNIRIKPNVEFAQTEQEFTINPVSDDFEDVAIAALQNVRKEYEKLRETVADVYYKTVDNIDNIDTYFSGAVNSSINAVKSGIETTLGFVRKSIEALTINFDQYKDRFSAVMADSLAQGLTFMQSLGNATLDIIKQIATAQVEALRAPIVGLFTSIIPVPGLGTLLGTAAFEGVKALLLSSLAKIGGFETGGFTGHGQSDSIAGLVHRGEFVHTADITRQNRDLFEYLHRGGTAEKYFETTNNTEIKEKIISVKTAHQHQFKPLQVKGRDLIALYDKSINSTLRAF